MLEAGKKKKNTADKSDSSRTENAYWRSRGSNPGPSAGIVDAASLAGCGCKADALPLSHTPYDTF